MESSFYLPIFLIKFVGEVIRRKSGKSAGAK